MSIKRISRRTVRHTTQQDRHFSFVVVDTNMGKPFLDAFMALARLEREMQSPTQHILVFTPLIHAEHYGQAMYPELRRTDVAVRSNKMPAVWVNETLALMNDPENKDLIMIAPLLPSSADIVGANNGLRQPSADEAVLEMVRKTLSNHWRTLVPEAKEKRVKAWFEAADAAGLLPAAKTPGFPRDLKRPLRDSMSDLVAAVLFTDHNVAKQMRKDFGDKCTFNKGDESIINLCNYLVQAVAERHIDTEMFDFTLMSNDVMGRQGLETLSRKYKEPRIRQLDFIDSWDVLSKAQVALEDQIRRQKPSAEKTRLLAQAEDVREKLECPSLEREITQRTTNTPRKQYLYEQMLLAEKQRKDTPTPGGKGS